jgi:uncharacterized protein (TIGR02996 family)
MTPERGFLDAIHADPDDRLTHAVYADWLEEQGDPRAELARALLAERQGPVEPRSSRVGVLLSALARTNLRRVAGIGRVTADPRGLLRVNLFNVPPASAPDHLDEWGWVTEVEITQVNVLNALADVVARLPLLRRLTLRPEPGQTRKGFRLGKSIAERPVEVRLDLSNNFSWERVYSEIAPLLPPGWLRELFLHYCRVGDGSVARLPTLPGLDAVRRLDLGGNEIGPVGVRHLARNASLPRLEVLTLNGERLGDTDLAELLDAPNLPALRELQLPRAQITLPGLGTWLRSRCGPSNGRPFRFTGCSLTFAQVSAPDGPDIRLCLPGDPATWVEDFASLPLPDEVAAFSLELAGSQRTGDIARVLGLPALSRLRRLALACLVDENLLRAVVTSPARATLTELTLPRYAVNLAALEPLVQKPLPALRVLRVLYLRPPGADAMLAALRERIPVVEIGRQP